MKFRLSLAVLLVVGALLAAMSLVHAKNTAPAAAAGAPKPLYVPFSPYPVMLNPVRIGLACRQQLSRVAVWSPGAVFVENRPVFELKPGLVYSIAGGRITEMATGRSFVLPRNARTQIAACDRAGNYSVWTSNKWWRGTLELISFGDRVTVINLLDLEDYLLGVVPAEMPASWHFEALKSQAVAARSYAFVHLGHGSKWLNSEGFDLVPDVRDQAYKGLAVEAPSARMAVWQTRGIILKNANKVKPGFYRATVGDFYENLNIRNTRVPSSTLEAITGVPRIVGVTVKQWDTNANAVRIQVIGEKKSREVYGVALAKMLNLSTAGIIDVHEEGNSWLFRCRGPGNGARGLSQHGANTLAKNGWLYQQILQHYYQDADGQLRLDFTDHYKAVAAMRARQLLQIQQQLQQQANEAAAANEASSTTNTSNTSSSSSSGNSSATE